MAYEDHYVAETAFKDGMEAGLERALEFVTDEQWRTLPATCYGLHALVTCCESLSRKEVDTITNGPAILRELLRRRPAEFGGPMEVR